MNVETKYNVGDKLYFIEFGLAKRLQVKSVIVTIGNEGVNISYKLWLDTVESRPENSLYIHKKVMLSDFKKNKVIWK